MHGGFARPPRRLISGKQRIKKEGFCPPLNWIYFVSASIRRLSTSGRATE